MSSVDNCFFLFVFRENSFAAILDLRESSLELTLNHVCHLSYCTVLPYSIKLFELISMMSVENCVQYITCSNQEMHHHQSRNNYV